MINNRGTEEIRLCARLRHISELSNNANRHHEAIQADADKRLGVNLTFYRAYVDHADGCWTAVEELYEAETLCLEIDNNYNNDRLFRAATRRLHIAQLASATQWLSNTQRHIADQRHIAAQQHAAAQQSYADQLLTTERALARIQQQSLVTWDVDEMQYREEAMNKAITPITQKHQTPANATPKAVPKAVRIETNRERKRAAAEQSYATRGRRKHKSQTHRVLM